MLRILPNQELYGTAIPLRSVVAGELRRWLDVDGFCREEGTKWLQLG